MRPMSNTDTNATDKQGPWTDVYALGATFYRAVTGRGPKDAMSRVHGILEGKERFKKSARLAAGKYSEKLLTAIDTALEFKPVDRPQTIQAWRQLLPVPPGFEPLEPEDDSGMDLLLVPDEEEEEEEETVVLSAPLIPESSSEDDEEEETVVLSAPLVDTPPATDEEVVISSPGVGETPEAAHAQPAAESREDEPPRAPPTRLGDDEETVIREAPVEPKQPAPPGDDEETVILGAPVQPNEPSQLGAQDETVILSATVDDNQAVDPDDEPTVVALSPGDNEAPRMPFATIRADLAKQAGDDKPGKPDQKEEKSVGKRLPSGMLRQNRYRGGGGDCSCRHVVPAQSAKPT